MAHASSILGPSGAGVVGVFFPNEKGPDSQGEIVCVCYADWLMCGGIQISFMHPSNHPKIRIVAAPTETPLRQLLAPTLCDRSRDFVQTTQQSPHHCAELFREFFQSEADHDVVALGSSTRCLRAGVARVPCPRAPGPHPQVRWLGPHLLRIWARSQNRMCNWVTIQTGFWRGERIRARVPAAM